VQLQNSRFAVMLCGGQRAIDTGDVARPSRSFTFFAFFGRFFAGPRDRFTRAGVVVDYGRFGRSFGDRLFGTARRVVGIVGRLAVLFLDGDLVVGVEARGDFVCAGVGGGILVWLPNASDSTPVSIRRSAWS
jgi:hypothetical protein